VIRSDRLFGTSWAWAWAWPPAARGGDADACAGAGVDCAGVRSLICSVPTGKQSYILVGTGAHREIGIFSRLWRDDWSGAARPATWTPVEEDGSRASCPPNCRAALSSVAGSQGLLRCERGVGVVRQGSSGARKRAPPSYYTSCGASCTVGPRAKLFPFRKKRKSNAAMVQATVTGVVPLGDEPIVHSEIGSASSCRTRSGVFADSIHAARRRLGPVCEGNSITTDQARHRAENPAVEGRPEAGAWRARCA